MSDENSPVKIVPQTTEDLVAEAERQLGSVISVGREHLRRIRIVMHGRGESHPLATQEARSVREIGDMLINILKWHYPRGKPEDHDRPLADLMADLFAQPGAREIAAKLLGGDA